MDTQEICDLGRTVIEIEAKMITNLIDRIDEKFAQACHHLKACLGRIVVMGVGKSGHIGKKIAATFASTGSPAFFVHPNEAKHGDMGMITQQDVVISLSNSGESEEILSVLPFLKRLNIPIIALTGKPHSRLAKAATIHLDISVEKEACPLGLAPTSSSTATLVMGDALAMVLLQQRGFSEQDFALSHPGGSLGRRLLLRVDEIMHQNDALPIVRADTSLKEALIVMTQKKLGGTVVVDDAGQLVGVFTDGDLRRALNQEMNIQSTPIHQVMNKHPKTISADLLAAEALQVMENYKITSLIITDKNQPKGLVHIHDIFQAGIA